VSGTLASKRATRYANFMTYDYDTVIIGGGHNGLVCAAYLAKAGQRVLVLERRDILGGAAVTESFHPGFRNSSCSYTLSLLHPSVMADLKLESRGLQIVKRRVNNIFPDGQGGGVRFLNDAAAMHAHIAQLSPADADARLRFTRDIDQAAAALKRLLLVAPPSPKGGLAAIFQAIQLGRDISRQSLDDQRMLLALATQSVADFLDRYFDSDAIKAAYAFDGVVGTYASPYQPGTAYVLLHHAFGEATGEPGVWGHAIGGMGAVSDAIWAAARSYGAKARTGAEVTGITLNRKGRTPHITGVQLASGETITARQIAANTTPDIVFGTLLPEDALPAPTAQAFKHIRYGSGTLRINVALAALPRFTGFEDGDDMLTGGIVLGPSMDYLETAYMDARRHGYARRPIVEMLIPSTLDDTLAPAGQHVASLFCQHVDYDALKADPRLGDKAVAAVLDTVEAFAPGFKDLVLGMRVLTPLDLEREYGLTRGDIFHGKLDLDQLFSARPVLGYSGYAMPVAGLYLCGSGAHPGGGVTGVPGRNCALAMLGR